MLSYQWSAVTVPAGGGVAFSANNTNVSKATVATFSGPGVYTLQCQANAGIAGLQSTSAQVLVTVNATASPALVVSDQVVLAAGGTANLTATALDQFGVALAPQPSVWTWTLSGGGTPPAGTAATTTVTMPASAATVSVSASATGVPLGSAVLTSLVNVAGISPLVRAPPFDQAAFLANPATYLATPVPGRIWQGLDPGPGIPALMALGPQRIAYASGTTSLPVAVGCPAGSPVTFLVTGEGAFLPSFMNCLTVQAESDNVARAMFVPSGQAASTVLVGGAMTSGLIRYSIVKGNP